MDDRTMTSRGNGNGNGSADRAPTSANGGFIGIDATIARQRVAADPNLSVFVSANAGSGKTHVLTERVVRLLLAGTEPSKILCLTYTRAAAAEMSGRVFKRLAGWATATPEKLSGEIESLDGRPPNAARLADARRLFASALETPGGLKIQTIHAFCEAILHQFPLEANVPGHFEVLDDAESAALLGEARRRLITSASRLTNSPRDAAKLAEAFSTALALAGEWGLDQLIGEIVRKRDAIRRHIDDAGGLDPAIAFMRTALGLRDGEDEADIVACAIPVPGFDVAFCRAAAAVAANSSRKTDEALVEKLAAIVEAKTPADGYAALKALCLKKDGGAYKASSVATKAVTDAMPDFAERLEALAAHVLATEERLASLALFRASTAALVLAETLERDYAMLKRRRGRLDFEDLIVRTAELLTRSDAASWVHYKLDAGIDHVLIDEAQDTSPRQWQVMRQLVGAFFEGETARNVSRTVFAVGDEKQSIYSFQGASPLMFDAERRAMEARATGAKAAFERIELTQSFRTASDILAAVDAVFADEQNRQGLTSTGEAPAHQTARGDAPGLVEAWPAFVAESRTEPRDWLLPVDSEPANSPANRLARRIAATIKDWLGDPIVHKGATRPLTAGDVLVLVRKRSGFVAAMASALGKEGIPFAGADRLMITDHIAVKDLMALGRAVANFDDDLSLAAVLKSPFFDFSDNELMGLALSRDEHEPLSLGLRRLCAEGGLVRVPDFFPDEATASFLAKCRAALERLEELRRRAGFETIFSFFARILGPEGGRARLTGRLGSDAGEPIDAFLDLALGEEDAGEPGLDAFLSRLAASPPQIKREMEQGRGEVRIMTTHASKGLEAPIVFLVDPGSAPFHAAHGSKLMEWTGMKGLVDGQAPGFLWAAGKDLENEALEILKGAEKTRAEEEYRRLLYVGMTRAADRLVVCGVAGSRGPNEASWLQRVSVVLAAQAGFETLRDEAGEIAGWRVGRRGVVASAAGMESPAEETGPDSVPFDLSPLPAEILPPRPLSPSSASDSAEIERDEGTRDSAALATTGDAEDAEDAGPVDGGGAEAPEKPAFVSPVLGPAHETRPSFAIRRGLFVHKLLQVLPDLPPEGRRKAAETFAANATHEMGPRDHAALIDQVFAVMDLPAFAPIFAPASRAEVTVSGDVSLGGKRYRVNGTIDRVAVTETEVLVVDYKTNRPAPQTLADVPPAYVLQLALYRELLKPLYPGRSIAAALLFTEAPRLIALDAATMEAALAGRRSGEPGGKKGPPSSEGATQRQAMTRSA